MSLLCNLVFLLRCRDNNLIPVFSRLQHFINTNKARNILNKASKALVKERIHHCHQELDIISKRTLSLHLRLYNKLRPDDIYWLDNSITAQVNRHKLRISTKQHKKFMQLQPPNQDSNSLNVDKVVINLSSKTLDQPTRSILKKGLNFAPTPRTVPIKNIISGVEQAIQKLPEEEAENIRTEVSLILKKARPPKSNISRSESNALHTLRNDKSLLVLPADKGNATVVMDTEDYNNKIQKLLSDSTYRQLQRDPINSLTRKTVNLVKSSGLPDNQVKSLTPHSTMPPRLYGVPKIHKEGNPLRPIVCTIGAPTYQLAVFLTGLIRPLIGTCSHHIKNSAHFSTVISDIKIKSMDLLVSFDVVSLFTKVPLKETLQLLDRQFSTNIVNLFKHVLTSTCFMYNNIFYEQTDGVAMGSPLSPAIANFFMENLEHRALATATQTPSYFFRYVDDTFVIWPHGRNTLDQFLDHLNAQHPNIRFTMEVESNGSLPFLDVLVTKKSDGSLGRSVYRKPTHTDRYLNASSHHHPAQKRAALSTLFHRAITVSDKEQLETEIHHLYSVFQQNNYTVNDIRRVHRHVIQDKKKNTQSNSLGTTESVNRAFLPFYGNTSNRIARILAKTGIKTVFLPQNKVQRMLRSTKDDIGLRTPGVYKISCECGSVYIGQTGRTVADRCKEHQRNIRLIYPDKSAVAQHALDNRHIIYFNDVKVIDKTPFLLDRLIKEAIQVKLESNVMNRDVGLQLSKSWAPALSVLRQQHTPSRNGGHRASYTKTTTSHNSTNQMQLN